MGSPADIPAVSTVAGTVTNPVFAQGAGLDKMTGGNLQGLISGNPLGGLNASTGINSLSRPELAGIQQATSVQDVQDAQKGAANSLEAQNRLLAALQGQNGLQSQNQALSSQQALAGQLAAANGVGTQQSAIQGLQGAAGQYQNIASGQGPNPARAMLNQATAQNVANQAALMAGQRGAGANAGLIARQAGQQGGALQQQAVGQGATMQANQQINALQGLVGAQQAAGNLGAGLTGQQGAANQAYAGQANQIAGQQIGAQQAATQNALANQQMQQNSLQGVNQANVANQSSVNAGNTAFGTQQIKGQQGILGGVLNGAGAAMGGLAHGGEVRKMADGGSVATGSFDPNAPTSSFGKFLSGFGVSQQASPGSEPEDAINKGTSNLIKKAASKLSGSGEIDGGEGEMMAGEAAPMGAGMAMAAKGGLAQKGGHVKAKTPAQKAEKKGDSYANDKVPTMLSEGEIVIPRSIVMGKDPIQAAAKFVEETLAKRKK